MHDSFAYQTLSSPDCTLQLTVLVSAPVENPFRKIYWDWGIQINYDMPFSPKNFINVPIWPNKWEDEFEGESRRRRELLGDHEAQGNLTWWQIAERYGGNDLHKHPSDFTAGELYYALENRLIRYEQHERCLHTDKRVVYYLIYPANNSGLRAQLPQLWTSYNIVLCDAAMDHVIVIL